MDARLLNDDEKKTLLDLAIKYAGAVACQEDGMDRAGFLVYDCRERLVAFVEGREPNLDDDDW